MCHILNYFLTLETNNEVLIYIVKLLSKAQNDLTIEILSDMLISSIDKNSDEKTKLRCEIANTMGKSKNQTGAMNIIINGEKFFVSWEKL